MDRTTRMRTVFGCLYIVTDGPSEGLGHLDIIPNNFYIDIEILSKGLCRLYIVIDIFGKYLDRFNISIDMVRNLQISSRNQYSLFFRERVQSQNRIFDLLSSRQLFQNLLCAIVSKKKRYGEWSQSCHHQENYI
jgi:hypothetical protein